MGVPFKQYLSGSKIYSCSNCRCHAADHDDIESRVRRWAPAFPLWIPWPVGAGLVKTHRAVVLPLGCLLV